MKSRKQTSESKQIRPLTEKEMRNIWGGNKNCVYCDSSNHHTTLADPKELIWVCIGERVSENDCGGGITVIDPPVLRAPSLSPQLPQL